MAIMRLKHAKIRSVYTGSNLAELRDAVEDQEDLWRKLTMAIARALRTDGRR